jgi:hypothetical protein
MDLRDAVERHLGFTVSKDNAAGVHVQVDMNAHPPTSVLLLAPFGYLDYPDAVLVWNLLSLAALGVSLWLIARAEQVQLPLWAVFPALTVLLLCNPLRQQIYLGQFNLVLLLLFVGIWRAARSEHAALAGSLLGLATVLKLFPGFLFLYFALRRQWKVLGVGVATAAVLTAITVAVMGTEPFRAYVVEVLPTNERCQSGWKNASVTGLWKKLFDPATLEEHVEPLTRSPALARLAALLSAAAVVGLLLHATRRASTPRQHDLTLGLAVLAMLMLSPIAWDHYFLMLFLPLSLIVARMPQERLSQAVFLFLAAVLWFDPENWYPSFIPGGREGMAVPWQTATVLSFQCYALVGLYLFGVYVFERSRGVVTEPLPQREADGAKMAHNSSV